MRQYCLEHVYAGTSIGCIDHEMHRPRRQENVAQRPQTDVGVGQMMEHAGADDLIEFASNFPDALDREPVELEIPDIVFLPGAPG